MPPRWMGNQIGRLHREAFNGLKHSNIQAPRSMATEMFPARGSALTGSRLFNNQRCPSQLKSTAGIRPSESPSHNETRTEQPIPTTKVAAGIDSRPSSQAPATIRPASVSANTAACQAVKHLSETWMAGAARMGARRQRPQTRLKTSVPFVPPKPKLFFTAYSIFMSRAVLAQ